MLSDDGNGPNADWHPPPPVAGLPAPPRLHDVGAHGAAAHGNPAPPAPRCRTCAGAIWPGQQYCSSCGHPPSLGSNFCPSCGRPTNPYTNPCPNCGAILGPTALPGPVAIAHYAPPATYVAAYPGTYPPVYGPPPKSKAAAVVLCLLCPAGAHRLYLGYTGQAIAQFSLVFFGGLLSAALIGIPLVLAGFIWILVDLVMILNGTLLDSWARPLA